MGETTMTALADATDGEDGTVRMGGMGPHAATVGIRRLGSGVPMVASVSRDGYRVSMRLARSIALFPSQCKVLRTGLSVRVPEGFVAMVVTDSTLAREYGVSVAGGTKVVTPGEECELVVSLQNLNDTLTRLQDGTRVFSLMLCQCPPVAIAFE